MRKLYTLLVLSILSFGVNAQTVSIIANLGTSGNIVVGGSSYHVLEAIYTDAEIGAGNFTTAGSAIQKINFFLNTEGANNAISSYSVWMKNVPAATTTLATGTYSRTGYTQVFTGTFNATPTGAVGVTLTTPFTRTAGTNLEILIERLDNLSHTGYIFYSANGNNTSSTLTTSRRYNSTIAPVSGTTSLTASAYRPAIQFIHQYPLDATVTGYDNPTVSCYNTNQTIGVEVTNVGTGNIPAGAAIVHLDITGANTFIGTAANTAVIAPGASEIVYFTGINLNNTGDNNDSAYVVLSGDGYAANNYLVSSTTTASVLGTSLSAYPIIEDVETTLPVFPYASIVEGADLLWQVHSSNYTNVDLGDTIHPRTAGTQYYYLFDSYSGAGSAGFVSRLYSNCIQMPTAVPNNAPPVTTISFWRTRDSSFGTSLDSLYLAVSTDKGQTWTRLAGYQRYDATAAVPYWKQEIVDVSAYNGQVVQFGFEGSSQYGNAFGLDDININYSGLAPVSLLSFDAKRSGRVNNLSWTTSQEVNTSRFVVERSTDGRTFAPIGEVTAAGNTTSAKDYRYIDAAPNKGTNYYRLRMIDNDNAYKMSEIRNVKNLGVAEMAINPNPVLQNMRMVLEAETAERAPVVITDLSGRKMYSSFVNVVAGTNNFEIPVSNLAKGSYIVTIQLNGQSLVKRINKL